MQDMEEKVDKVALGALRVLEALGELVALLGEAAQAVLLALGVEVVLAASEAAVALFKLVPAGKIA
jgi:hypothetical protein